MKKILFIIILAGSVVHAAEQRDRFEYSAQINLPDKTESGSFVINISDEIYDHSAISLSDIRIIDLKGNYIPYVVTPLISTKYENYSKTCKSVLQKLNKLENNKIELIIENQETNKLLIPDKITVLTRAKNYEKQVQVFGSDNIDVWAPKLNEGRIFDFFDIANIANREVSFPGKRSYKYYKIIIDNFTERTDDKIFEVIEEIRSNEKYSQIKKQKKIDQALKIDKIILSSVQQRKSTQKYEQKKYKIKSFSINEKDNSTEILLTTFRQPVSSLEIFTDNLNYSREISVEGSNDGKNFHYIKRNKISKISIPGYKKSENIISFGEKKFKYYKLTIINKGTSPLNIKDVEMTGIQYQIRFIVDNIPDQLSIFFGNSIVKKPYYEIADVLRKIKPDALTVCTINPVKENPYFHSKRFTFLDKKVLLYVFVGLMIILLSYAIFVAMKKIES